MENGDQILQKVSQLLRLMDAESAEVRKRVRQELHAMDEDLEALLQKHAHYWQPEQSFWLHEIVNQKRRRLVRQDWLDWLDHADPYRQLETGFATLSQLQTDIESSAPLPYLLDELCDRFLAIESSPTSKNLNHFLFRNGLLNGARSNYYHPKHSHLPHVITHGEGLPLSLSAIFMLVGDRLNLDIVGLNLPGHFLARSGESEELAVFDCFNKGKILKQHELFSLTMSPHISFEELLSAPPSPAEIIMRALMNLIHAYRKTGQHQQFHFMQDLLADLYLRLQSERPQPEPQTDISPNLAVGQLVRHKKYGYRGVVVDFDLDCQAADAWYRNNLTQPNKNQPWYHVLVDRSESTTYAAQSNLEPDDETNEIHHPLIPIYFEKFSEGQYLRNQVPWKLELP